MILSLASFLPLREKHHQLGERVVFTNGCFDLLHSGHLRYLQAAREQGDYLVVGLNSDSSVNKLGKGPGRPIIPEGERAEVLDGFQMVDYVILFQEETPAEIIGALLPDILIKGGDWGLEAIVGRDTVEAHGGKVISWPLVPGKSTTNIVQIVKDRYPK